MILVFAWAGLAVGAAILWSLGRAAAAPAAIRCRERSLALPRLPASADGLRVLHLSDIHLHPRADARAEVLARAERLRPDLVAVTGDLASSWRGLALARSLLDQLAARWPTYVVAGNADHWADRFDRHLRRWHESGAKVLTNRGEALPGHDGQVWIAGVDDPHRYRHDVARALAGAPRDAFVLLLAHSPDVTQEPESRRADLILAGHTHGGQVRLPLVGALLTRARLGRKWASGVFRRSDTVVIVTTGVGTTRLGVRFWCPPEMTLWVLRRAETG